MKNLFIGLVVLGLTSLSYSQELYSEVDQAELEDRPISYVNSNYINKVQNVNISQQVKSLEELVSRFDITNNRKFDGHLTPFKVRFNGRSGYIIASFDNSGEILKSKEKFKNIDLPLHVLQSISKAYPKAAILGNTYMVSYDIRNDVLKQYTVKIKKNNFKKNLRIDSEGNIK